MTAWNSDLLRYGQLVTDARGESGARIALARALSVLLRSIVAMKLWLLAENSMIGLRSAISR